MTRSFTSIRPAFGMLFIAAVIARPVQPAAQAPVPLVRAMSGEAAEATPEISTADMESVLAAGSAVVLDARPHAEFAMGHIPGAVNVAPKPGVTASMYVSDVAEIGRIVGGNKTAALVLYCNGVHCGKSKRLAAELLEAGFTSVRRYQLGMPVWRAVGNISQVELDAVKLILSRDATAVVVDTREPAAFKAGSLPQAINIPRSLVVDAKDMGEVRRAKDDGRLPMNDHNTRILVVGVNATSARYVAERLAREAFSNVGFLEETAEQVMKLLAER